MRTSHLIIFIVALFCSCKSATDYFNDAKNAVDKGDYGKAIGLLDKALAKKKNLQEAYTEKGYCYSKLGKDDSAVFVYSQLLAFSPDNTLALYNSGLCKYRQDKPGEALSYFNKAMMTEGYDPNDTSKLKLTLEYTEAGKQILGIDDRFDVPLTDLFYMAGLAHFDLGQMKNAYKYFTKCISKDFNLGESYYMIGLCWLNSNNNEKACEAFRTSYSKGYSLAKDQVDKVCN